MQPEPTTKACFATLSLHEAGALLSSFPMDNVARIIDEATELPDMLDQLPQQLSVDEFQTIALADGAWLEMEDHIEAILRLAHAFPEDDEGDAMLIYEMARLIGGEISIRTHFRNQQTMPDLGEESSH